MLCNVYITLNLPEVKPGCHKFVGKVECQNGHGILPSAKVAVMESDFMEDDEISTAEIDRFGNYRIFGCTNKEVMGQPAHFYLQFKNVCYNGQQERTGHPIPNEFETYKFGLKDDEMVTLVNDDAAAVTSMPTKAKHHRRSKYPYPPQPRPRHRRQNSDIGAGVEDVSGKFGQGCYTFGGQVHCQNGQILPSAKVAVMQSDNVMADDFVSIAKIDRFGTYQIMGCTNDAFMGQQQFAAVELYLEFKDVCFDGQKEEARNPKPNLFETHQLGNENANDSPQQPIPRQDPQQPNVNQTPQPHLHETPPPRSS
uniref:Transthyretin-like family protein n=1 Tax=Panagrolaimus davidi TaxID=227884 RepID=A0A914Q1Z7_9BILA